MEATAWMLFTPALASLSVDPPCAPRMPMKMRCGAVPIGSMGQATLAGPDEAT